MSIWQTEFCLVLVSLEFVEHYLEIFFLILSQFSHKIKHKISHFDHAHWCWQCSGRLVMSDVILGVPKSKAISFSESGVFEHPATTNESMIPDMLLPFMEPRLFFCWNSWSSSLGVASTGTLQLNFVAKNLQK